MRVAAIQMEPIFGKKQQNVQAAIALMETVHADLYVLPELFNTGYLFLSNDEVEGVAEPLEGATTQALLHFARMNNCYLAYGFAEKAGRCYNSAAFVGPKGILGFYRKVHLFNREHLFFAPGDGGFPVFPTPFGTVGMMICFDWFFPESARTLALKGAQLIAHPSNLLLPHCPDAMMTRCLENKVFAATANRIGEERRGEQTLRFIGMSEIVSPRGEVLHRLDSTTTGYAYADVDLREASVKKINEFNDLLAGRRVDQYR
jgi:5-aminopentanamidase